MAPRRVGRLWARLLELKASAWIGITLYFRYPAWIVADIITTPIWLLVFILPALLFMSKSQWGNPETLNFLFWAMTLWGVVSSGIWSFGNAIRWEQQAGTIEALFLTNASRAVLFARRVFSGLLTIMLDTLYMAFFFVALFNIPLYFNNVLGVAAALLMGLLISAGFGLTYGALVLRFKNVGPLNNVVQFILLGVSAIFYPVTAVPEPFRAVVYASPYTYVANLLRHEAMGEATILSPIQEWLLVAILAAVFLAAGAYTLRRVEENLKKRGELGTY